MASTVGRVGATQQYLYLYVPKASTGNAAEDVGTVFRLGSYSNFEETLTTEADQAAVYPAQYITDSGGGTAAIEGAAGENGEHGILLACDGRVLVKSSEKTYINSEGNIHIESNSGQIDIISGTNQDIVLNAGASTGDIHITATNEFKEVTEQATKKHGGRTYDYYTSPKEEFYETNLFKIVWGRVESHHMGGKLTTFFGGAMTIQLAVKFSLDLALHLAISVLSKFYLYGLKCELGLIKLDLVEFKFEIKKGKFESAWNKIETVPVKAMITGAKAVKEEVCLAMHTADIKKKGVEVGDSSVVAKKRDVMAQLVSSVEVKT